MNQGEVLIPSKDKLKIELYREQKKWSFNIVTLPTSNSHSKWKPRSSEWKTLEYTRLVNSTFCVHWLASSEVTDKYYSPPNSQRYKILNHKIQPLPLSLTLTEVKQFFGSYVVNNKTITFVMVNRKWIFLYHFMTQKIFTTSYFREWLLWLTVWN